MLEVMIYRHYIKRMLDLLIVVILLPFFLFVWILITPLIIISDGFPVFFKGERIGKAFKLFPMYKFRTMKNNVEHLINQDGSTYNNSNDSRLTGIGKFLRESSIDEIPQIINVLKGDMSLVGPRASMDISLGTFQEDEIGKMDVKPGITGYTQAYFRNSISNREKRLYDAWYAQNISFKLDCQIIIKTIFVVIRKENLYTNDRTRKPK